MTESAEDIRVELVAAIANVRRQIDEQVRTVPMVGDGGSARIRNTLLGELRTELAQLEDALARLGSDQDT